MSEFIVVQVGQCGNQIGSSLWPRILQEYDVSLKTNSSALSKKHIPSYRQDSISSFFEVPDNRGATFRTYQDLVSNGVKARAVCIDMEDRVISRFRSGPFRELFDERCLINDYCGSNNNWAAGFNEHGPKNQQLILNTLRRSMEKCDSFGGFLFLLSTGGGTGSGLGTYLLSMLEDYHPKLQRFVTCVYSASEVIVSPYNDALATHQLLQHATCVFPVENKRLFSIVKRNEDNRRIELATKTSKDTTGEVFGNNPNYSSVNPIVVDMILHVTSGSRFAGKLNMDMNEIGTSMVPIPGLNYVTCGFNQSHSLGIASKITKAQKESLFCASYHRNNQLISTDPINHKHRLLASTILGRGGYCASDLVFLSERLQRRANFTPWSRKCVKLGLCDVPPLGQDVSLCSLFNSTATRNLFENILDLYRTLFKSQAHLHCYENVRNFDASCFDDCRESLLHTIEKYRDLDCMLPKEIPARLMPY